ncbi:Peptide transporter ptr1, partial [Dissophora globulifera]
MPVACYFILPNEFGERFCYYGVQPNLNKYFRLITGMNPADAKVFSTAFTMLAYFFPLIGAALSDSFLGKWWTIITFSCVYLVGMIMLTIFSVPGMVGE